MTVEIIEPNKIGRPSEFTQEVFDDICEQMAKAKACGRFATIPACQTDRRSCGGSRVPTNAKPNISSPGMPDLTGLPRKQSGSQMTLPAIISLRIATANRLLCQTMPGCSARGSRSMPANGYSARSRRGNMATRLNCCRPRPRVRPRQWRLAGNRAFVSSSIRCWDRTAES